MSCRKPNLLSILIALVAACSACQAAMTDFVKTDMLPDASPDSNALDDSSGQSNSSDSFSVTEFNIGFTTAEGFVSSDLTDINTAAAPYHFSLTNEAGTGVSLYPHPEDDTADTDNMIYFNPDTSAVNVAARIDFLVKVRNLSIDIVYFDSETVTLSAIGEGDKLVAEVQGTDGDTLSVTAHQAGTDNPVHAVRLTGNAGGAALNLDNLHYWVIE